jgi:hypothetical protein
MNETRRLFGRGGCRCAYAATALAILFVSAALCPADARPKHHPRHEVAEKKEEPKIPPGPLTIVISIATQRVTLYAGDTAVAQSGVSTGMRGHPTPTGVFSVIQKARYHRSNIYSGAPMPFMQRITWSGVALHAGVLPGYPASHGCIRLSNDFAQFLWRTTKLGARVIVAQGDVVPVIFAHPQLPEGADDAPALRGAVKPDAPIHTAANTTIASDAPAAEEAPAMPSLPDYPPLGDLTDNIRETLIEAALKKNARPGRPISLFVSRKTKRLYARQGFVPLFDVPIGIRDDDKPMGTHVFTIIAGDERPADARRRWTAISLPPDAPKPERKSRREEKAAKRGHETAAASVPAPPAVDAAEALDRVDMPASVRHAIAPFLIAGTSLILSDHGLGEETGEGTDFIVVTR